MRTFFLLFLALFSTLSLATSALSVKQVAPGIYVHFGKIQFPNQINHGANIANIGFVVGDNCVAVIDTGGNLQEGQALKQAIKKTTDKPICYVINTHVHPDHIFGNLAFKEKNIHFIGHHKLARAMAARGHHYIDTAASLLKVNLSVDNIIPPDMPVKKHMSINLGSRELILTAYPTAHTDNDLTIYDKKTNTIWLADLLFVKHIPTLDGSIKGWLKVINGLEKHAYRHVIPGHGPLVNNWPAAIQPEKAYLNNLITEVRPMVQQGEFIEDAVKRVGLSAKKDWLLFEDYHRRNVMSTFAELEWED